MIVEPGPGLAIVGVGESMTVVATTSPLVVVAVGVTPALPGVAVGPETTIVCEQVLALDPPALSVATVVTVNVPPEVYVCAS
jgi:hypothetical protein